MNVDASVEEVAGGGLEAGARERYDGADAEDAGVQSSRVPTPRRSVVQTEVAILVTLMGRGGAWCTERGGAWRTLHRQT